MNNNNSTSITTDEAALYDRQIRLWGLDAQERQVIIDSIVYLY
jgi:molybdopterin/thiamine biosynthesis adenylyltransferase